MRNLGIRNYRELNAKLSKLVQDNIHKLNNDAYVLVSEYVGRYYKEWKPNPNEGGYTRTYQFLDSVKKVDVVKMGNAYFCQVSIDYENISYVYDFGDEAVIFNDGYWAISAANEGNHGYETVGYTSDKHFWDDALNVVYNDYILHDFAKRIENETGCECYNYNGGWLVI